MGLSGLVGECRRRLYSLDRYLVAHHWDADGVATAALLLMHLPGRGRPEPVEIGFYTWKAIPRPAEGEGLVVVDYGIPGVEYDRLAVEERLEAVVDHHRVPPPERFKAYCNPVSLGLAGEADYPGASVLTYHILASPEDDASKGLSALGAVGDLAPYYDSGRSHPGLKVAESLVEGTRYTLKRLRRVADLVDSAYRILDHKCLARAAMAASEGGVEALESLPCLSKAYERSTTLLREALELLEGPTLLPAGVRLYRLEMNAHVTSAVGRRLASKNPDSIVALLHVIPELGVARLYVRSVSKPLAALRESLASMGVRVAGKESVIVVEAPANKADWLARTLWDAASRLS